MEIQNHLTHSDLKKIPYCTYEEGSRRRLVVDLDSTDLYLHRWRVLDKV